MRKLKLFIATSADGYIARPDDNLDWLSLAEHPGEDYGYAAFMQTIDTVMVGRKTYDKVLTMSHDFPHKDKTCYIITRTPRPADGNLIFYTDSLETLVKSLKQQDGKDIFCDVGAEVINELFAHNLIDECIISIVPVFLGDGIPLFKPSRPETKLRLLGCQSFPTGLVQLHYQSQ